MQYMTLEEIAAALQDRNSRKVAEAVDLHPDTILAIRRGTASPTERTLNKLRAYLGAKE